MSNNVKFLGEIEANKVKAPIVESTQKIITPSLEVKTDIVIGQGSLTQMINELQNDKADKATTLEGYGIGDAYTKEETLNFLKEKPDKATTLEGYGITDAYDKTEIDTKLKDKADKATTLEGYSIGDAYTKEEILNLLKEKSDKATTLQGYNIQDAYNKNEVYAKTETYNREEIDDLLVDGGFQGDWNANQGEAGYIQNKPEKFLHHVIVTTEVDVISDMAKSYLTFYFEFVADTPIWHNNLSTLLSDERIFKSIQEDPQWDISMHCPAYGNVFNNSFSGALNVGVVREVRIYPNSHIEVFGEKLFGDQGFSFNFPYALTEATIKECIVPYVGKFYL